MALIVSAYSAVTTEYFDQRQKEEQEKYCIDKGYQTWNDTECLQEYREENLDDDRSEKVLDDLNQLYDFCYDRERRELCRIYYDNLIEITQLSFSNGELIWVECQEGEPEEWTRTHCPYGLADSQTTCKQSGAGSITMPCSSGWVLI